MSTSRRSRSSRQSCETTDFAFEPPPPTIVGERSREIAVHFGLDSTRQASGAAHEPRRRVRCPIDLPETGELMLLCGASGSGKSSLLRALRRRAARNKLIVIDLARITLPEKPVIDLFNDLTLERTLKRLARVGLAEVWTWLRPPSQLSEGQRWRLRLALAIARVEASESASPNVHSLLVCDEFAALLDRVTASIVATVLRRTVRAHADRLAAIVATSHDDLHGPLEAEVTVECDFGRVSVTRKGGGR